MNNNQEEIELHRDVTATLIPHGEEFILSKGDKVTVTHKLGGNFTVMTLNGMYRIAAKDADSLGKEKSESSSEVNALSGEPADEEQIRDNLRTVFDPEIPVNIYELGLIYKIEIIDGQKVVIDMTLTTPNCPVADSLPKMVKNNILSLEEVNDVDLKLVWDPPWTKDKMSEAAKLELNL